MSELAEKRIAEAKRTRARILILSNDLDLTILPVSIAELEWLEILNISYTQVSDLSPLEKLANIQILFIYNTQVSNLSPLEKLDKLQSLDVSYTLVNDLSPLEKLANLHELYILKTLVSDLSPLEKLANLQTLNVSITHVSNLSPLNKLANLISLKAHNTQVSDLSSLEKLAKLKELQISNTQVKKLAPLASIQSLEYFNAEGCPIEDCPTDVYQSKNGAELRAFFERQQASILSANQDISKLFKGNLVTKTKAKGVKKSTTVSKPDNRLHDVKLILLGNSNAGKTNLLHYLTTGKFLGNRKSTHGLEVHRWLPDAERFPLLKNVAVSIWDFGGQEYYHGAYRLFMSANAVYLMLWDKDTDCNGRRSTCLVTGGPEIALEHFKRDYWLDTVRHYGGANDRSPLLVVQNKVEDIQNKERLSQDEHVLYSIQESFHISLMDGCQPDKHPRAAQMLRHLERELEHALSTMMDATPLPVEWQQIRNSLLELQAGKKLGENPFAKRLNKHGDGSLSLKEFEAACEELLGKPLLESERGSTLPKVLERGGVVVYFENSEKLKDRVFLRPAKLADSIYEVLKEKVLEQQGEFEANDVIDEQDKDFRKVFIEATQSMGLVFPHPNKKNAYIAPQYLPAEHPIEDLYKIASHGAWDSAYWVKVPLFYYKKLLHGLVLHYASDGTEARYFWKHGIFFLKDGVRVLIKGLYPKDDEREGIIMVGVEKKENKEEAALQKEIFEQIKWLLIQREDNITKSKFSLTEISALTSSKIKELQDASLKAMSKLTPEQLETIAQQTTTMKTVKSFSDRMEKIDKAANFYGSILQPSSESANISKVSFEHMGGRIGEPTKIDEKLKILEVSRDGEYFVFFMALSAKAEQNEIKITAKDKDDKESQVLIRHFEPLLDRPPKQAKKVFVSYSHKNTPWLGRLRAHLSGLRRSNEIEAWDDREILPGEEWDKSIKDKLNDADVFILLLSADFIASNYIWDVELKTAIEGYKSKGKQVIPILIEPLDLGGLPGVDNDGTKIQGFEIVPKDKNERLLAVSLWPSVEEGLAKVAERIRMAIVSKNG